MNRILATTAIVFAVAAGGYWFVSQSGNETAMAAQAESVGDASGTSAEFGITEMTMGDPDATIEIIEYASFTCPHCATAHANLVPQVKENYVDTGKVKFTHREVYFDKYGMWASLIARCGGEAKYFGIIDLIYKGQAQWARAGNDAAIADELRKIGRLAGIGKDELDACMSDGEKLKNLVAWYQANATAHEIQSTPSFVVDGKKYANMSYAEFSAILDEKLGE
ncbi:DsbA family protein [Pacificoceanicola onchidii]|uniref:DsbA family protein n=1 Tax=Pacificoceanicola onchidii TaxID=2562685 RepID=UPI0010A4EF04|nr:DsbA family protein [Pacificoceanicola onchidii]